MQHTYSDDDRRLARLAHWLTVLGALGALTIAVLDPEFFERLSRHDDVDRGGLFEHLTVIILVTAIPAGVFVAIRLWRCAHLRRAALWVATCTLGALYFAGEEASWGQWYFGWETPEAIAARNRQNETNLHNLNEWFSYKPKLLAQLFVIFAGWLVPWMLHLQGRQPPRERLMHWVLAPRACWVAGAIFPLLWALSSIELPPVDGLGSSEFRELWIAWFLVLYLVSFVPRVTTPAAQGAEASASAGPVSREPARP